MPDSEVQFPANDAFGACFVRKFTATSTPRAGGADIAFYVGDP